MISLLKTKSQLMYCILAALSGISFFVSADVNTDIPTQLLYRHITYYLTVPLLVIVCATRLHKNMHIKNNLITRLGYVKFIVFQYATSFLILLCFTLMQYMVLFLYGNIAHGSGYNMAVFALIVNIILYISIWLILNLITFGVNGSILAIICVFLGLVVHYAYYLFPVISYYPAR
jgi:hypothetical protein